MDISDKIVMTEEYTSSIDVSALPEGMYTLIYLKDGDKKIKRFVKR